MHRLPGCLFSLALAAFLLGTQQHTCGADRRCVIVIDASSSMNREMAGTNRMDVVRRVLERVLETWDPTIDLGLVAYGHRKSADCNDIEVLVPPGYVDPVAYRAALSRLNPVGMTPLTSAVRTAAESLDYTRQTGTIVLLTDGVETCGGEPEDLALELLRKGAGLRVNIVALQLDPDALGTFDVLATQTGGNAVVADDEAELFDALNNAIRSTATATAGPQPGAPVRPSGAATGILELETLSSSGGSPVAAFYSIRNTDPSAEVIERTGVGPRFHLDPGSYIVEAKWGRARASTTVRIAAGETIEETLVLSAGRLHLSASLAGSKTNIRVIYKIYRDTGEGGDRELFASNSSGRFRLPEGDYLVGAEWNGFPSPLVPVEVVENRTVNETLTVEGGILNITSLISANGEEARAHYSIYRLPEGAAGAANTGGELIESGAMTPGGFKVPIGRYRIEAAWGEVTRETIAEVVTGRAADVEIVLDAATLLLTPKGPPDMESRVTFSIAPPEDPGAAVASGSAREFRIPAGRYTIIATAGAYQGQTEIDLAAGARRKVEIELE